MHIFGSFNIIIRRLFKSIYAKKYYELIKFEFLIF